jgi:uroporphyrinogen decarboxylase
MTRNEMTSLERTLATLSHKEPDRVPLFLNLTMHGARELNQPIKTYYAEAQLVVKGQEILRKKYGHDCLTGFCYGAAEVEAFGGSTLFFDNGPPNAGAPPIRDLEAISSLEVPDPRDCPPLLRMLEATRTLADRYGDSVPVAGVAISPFSLPVMQLGFSRYLDLLLSDDPLFRSLMEVNKAFCTTWANLQIEAGATAVVYFDPVTSPTIIPPDLARKTGLPIAREMIRSINGGVVYHLASGRSLAIADDLMESGAIGLGVSSLEDLSVLKERFAGKMTLIGNLDGVSMSRWSAPQAEDEVRAALSKAAFGGGFILSDNHGEIPWQVADSIISAIAEATRTYGRYPIA